MKYLLVIGSAALTSYGITVVAIWWTERVITQWVSTLT